MPDTSKVSSFPQLHEFDSRDRVLKRDENGGLERKQLGSAVLDCSITCASYDILMCLENC
jgi:hypothetical protein